MSRNVLVVSPARSIGGLLVEHARSLVDTRVFYCEHSQTGDLSLETLSGVVAGAQIDEAWRINSPDPDSAAETNDAHLLREFLALLRPCGLKAFHTVFPVPATFPVLSSICRDLGVQFRSFSTTQLVQPELCEAGENFWVSHFLIALHELKSEIEERWSEYFDYQALRYWVREKAVLNLVHADQFVTVMFRIAASPATAGSHFQIVNANDTSFRSFCEQVGSAYDLSLIRETEFAKCNAVDRLFQMRLRDFPASDSSVSLPDSRFEFISLSEQEQLEMWQLIRDSQDAARAKSNARTLKVPERLTLKTIVRGTQTVSYSVGGKAGSPIVILNALGHGLTYWHRLLDYLLSEHRILILDQRTTASSQRPAGLADQARNLEAVLEHEGIERCHLLGWCTGAKIAVAFYKRRPSAVASMILLNSSFKCADRAGDFDMPYEQQLEQVCRSLVEQPTMVGVVRKSFWAKNAEPASTLFSEMNGEELATAILARTNEALQANVLDPFESEAATLNYAHQILDFLTYDAVPDAAEVHVPVLLVGTEHDSVASPQTSRFMAQVFPNAQSVEIPGATHYCLHDRPRLIAGLIADFLKSLTADGDLLTLELFSQKQEALWT